MNKGFFLIFAIIIGSSVSAQKVYQFDKIGIMGTKVKAESIITIKITDSVISIQSESKGVPYEYNLKVISKDENNNAATYNCVGQIGVSDKHQFSFISNLKMAIWNSYNSLDNSKIEQLLYYKNK